MSSTTYTVMLTYESGKKEEISYLYASKESATNAAKELFRDRQAVQADVIERTIKAVFTKRRKPE